MSHAEKCARTLSAEGITVVELDGDIDVYTAPAFRDALEEAIDAGALRIVVDLAKVTFMDSTGLGVLVGSERRLKPLGGSLALACAGTIGQLLLITGLDRVFTLYASRNEALHAVLGAEAAVDTALRAETSGKGHSAREAS